MDRTMAGGGHCSQLTRLLAGGARLCCPRSHLSLIVTQSVRLLPAVSLTCVAPTGTERHHLIWCTRHLAVTLTRTRWFCRQAGRAPGMRSVFISLMLGITLSSCDFLSPKAPSLPPL